MKINYIFGIFVALLLVFAAGCAKKSAEQPLTPETPAEGSEAGTPTEAGGEQTAGAEASGEAAPAENAGTEGAAKETAAGEAKPAAETESTVDIVSERTIIGSPYSKDIKEGSWFSGVSCRTGEKSSITFTLANNGKDAFYLFHVSPMDRVEKNPISINVNSRNIKDIKSACNVAEGQSLKPGESITCSFETMIRTGKDFHDVELVNSIEADASDIHTKITFKC